MIRLAVVDGKFIKPVLVENQQHRYQVMVDYYCAMSFRHRTRYLENLSDVEPFSKDRATEIMDIMMSKIDTDPTAYALGNGIRRYLRLLE